MHSWLLDNFLWIVMPLSIAAMVLVYCWWRTRRRKYAIGAAAALALAGVVCLLVYLLPLIVGESDSAQIERKVREMAAAVKTRDLDRIFSHISGDFRFNTFDKAAFRQKAEKVIRDRDVEDVVVWEFVRGEISRENGIGKISFMVKAKGDRLGGETPYRCDADFVLDHDGQWRLRGFQLFNPFRESNEPIHIPGF